MSLALSRFKWPQFMRSRFAKFILGISAIALTTGLATLAVAAVSGPNHYAVLCGSCDLGSPMPTSSTRDAIHNHLNSLKHASPWSAATMNVMPGDTVTVCNGTACVTYTYNSSGTFLGQIPSLRSGARQPAAASAAVQAALSAACLLAAALQGEPATLTARLPSVRLTK